MSAERQIALINGPNLNLLGTREPQIYGSTRLDTIIKQMESRASEKGFSLKSFQSNSEGGIIDAIQQLGPSSLALIINPAAYSHTSIAIRDALSGFGKPLIEVHISNIFKRESFRHHSYVSEVADAVICGMGAHGYNLALDYLFEVL